MRIKVLGFCNWYAIVSLSLLILILSVGCTSPVKHPDTINDSVTGNFPLYQGEDFEITINGSPPIKMNYSTILARNYGDIPNLIPKDQYSSVCNFSGNASAIAGIALHDSRVKTILKEGGILQGVGWYVPFHPEGPVMQGGIVYCVGHPSLDIRYSDKSGIHYRSFIVNETNKTVDSFDTV